jgi:hypothetical protein
MVVADATTEGVMAKGIYQFEAKTIDGSTKSSARRAPA